MSDLVEGDILTHNPSDIKVLQDSLIKTQATEFFSPSRFLLYISFIYRVRMTKDSCVDSCTILVSFLCDRVGLRIDTMFLLQVPSYSPSSTATFIGFGTAITYPVGAIRLLFRGRVLVDEGGLGSRFVSRII